jgi:hypothetical protein
MQEDHDENERALAGAVSCVREFVVQQVQNGRRADALSFALAFIAIEMGLHVTPGRNPLDVVRTALQGMINAAEAFTVDEQPDASSETGSALTLGTDAVPKGTMIH